MAYASKIGREKSTFFDNEDKHEMITEARTLAPFPDVAEEAPGILTKQEELMGVSKVI
jgi:hypothetical protein